MALAGNDKAYLSARGGIARGGASRGNYVFPLDGVLTVGGVDLSTKIRHGSLKVNLALNEQPDTCSFDCYLFDAATQSALVVGADVVVGLGGPTANVLFGGRILTTQTTRHAAKVPSLRSVMCADYLQVLDSELLITYDWPAQSATVTILDLAARFANKPGGVALSTAGVEPNLPTHQAFAVTNERWSTVLRRIVTMFPSGGGFYVDALKTLQVWSGTSEPNAQNPTPLTVGNELLKQFAETVDGSQVRDAVLVEGLRTTAPLGIIPGVGSLPVQDASILDKVVDQAGREVRIGAQRLVFQFAVGHPWGYPAGSPSNTTTRAAVPYAPGPGQIVIPINDGTLFGGHFQAWVRIDEQFLLVTTYNSAGTSSTMTVPKQGWGAPTGPIASGATVELVDHLYGGSTTGRYDVPGNLETVRTQPLASDVVMTVRSGTGIHEHFIQDGRYSRAGAAARGAREIADFSAPLVSIQFETDDLNAKPGRLQAYNFVEPPLAATSGSLMILTAELTWPKWGDPPRRSCYAANVAPADVVDTWLVDTR